ncbi:outer membrane lipoprotein carrier protein LolA [Bacteroides sp. 224]|uniref:LolA family protein n=1 Tax=Bacteroides sp. 224 TaxID=2302936 RepID=UPI0013D06A83|nr:outer membrane lipoprotein carrier protein LolA [Bacteroides sp. 224]NDV63746.1 outer membrane lipoprotein carrier protein LolA [Bacteroides sp. 224]
MKRISFLTAILLSSLLATAQTINHADAQVLEKIKQENIKYNTMTCHFKQVKHLEMLGEDIDSEGKLYYTKPDKLAMRYDDPEGEVMLINGDKLVMVAMGTRREVSAQSNAKMQGMKTILSACLEGDVKKVGASKITCKETTKYYVVTAAINPASNKSDIVEVVLSYDKSTLTLSILKTIEADDSYTIYELTNKKFNQPIADSIYQN